jgi:selenocysteine lyase/cysteine desulfurase
LLSPVEFNQSSGLVSFQIPGNSCAEIRGVLHEKYKIFVRLIPHYNAMRIATAHFNSRLDIDHLMQALDAIVRGR